MILALVKSNVKVFDKIQQQQQRWSSVKQLLSLSICIVSGQWPGNPLLLPLSWQPPVLLLHEQRDDIMTMASAQCLGLASGHDVPGNLAMSRSGPATAQLYRGKNNFVVGGPSLSWNGMKSGTEPDCQPATALSQWMESCMLTAKY